MCQLRNFLLPKIRLGDSDVYTRLDSSICRKTREPLKEESRQITAFTVPGKGMYQFKKMTFGLTNAPAIFQRLMKKIITPNLKHNVFCHLDDIIVVTKNYEEHLKRLETVLEKTNKEKLTISLEKWKFGCTELKYLGLVLNEKGEEIDKDENKTHTGIPNAKKCKTTTKNNRNDIVVQKIHTKIC